MRVILASPEAKVWSERKHIPLGLGYLAATLRQGGHDPFIFDAAIEDVPVEYYIEQAEAEGRPYSLIGITATTPLIGDAWDMAKVAKRYDMITVLGGPHLTIMPRESLEPQHWYVDYVFKGEAEYTFLELVNTIEAGRPVELLPGMHMRGPDGEIISDYSSPMIEDLDSLPFPAHDLFKIDKYTNLQPLTDGLDPHARSFTILTSRGCPYKCTFCSKPVTGDTWRGRSVENVVAEWRWLVKDLGATEIGVTDDIWNLKLPRAKELMRRLIEEGLNTVPWVTVHGMKVNHTDLELFQLMKAAGCKRVGFGVENGDPYMLRNVIRKGQTLDQVRDAFKNAKAANLQTMGFFIFGMPNETEETMEATIQLALELDPDLANFMLAAPFPGTKMYDMIEEGGEIFANEWPDFAIHEQKARFTMNDGIYDPDLVIRKWREAYRRFYLYRPKRVWDKMSKKSFWLDMPNTVDNARRFFLGKNDQSAPSFAPEEPVTSMKGLLERTL
ncbi:MAG: radical SAM protein [Anaerolineales bacterium]|nr:radical SAM protein [Anaerolineae bacterium]MCB9130210.1 radical SAM protein [Anaerolineales bacterium]MCO5246865.1 B12-binding domain-containing radical SAM protein [Anaerolineae bacterium]HRX02356.1 radical SAM protein [Anaerolineae bacterium]